LLEIRHRDCGELLLKMPLYEFLQSLHEDSVSGVGFEDLRVTVGGKELMPSLCARA